MKPIKSVYFDSTFCLKSTLKIPDRKISRDLIVKFSQEWLLRGPKRKIFLYCAAKYGQEFLICQLSEALKTKIHVSKAKFRIYEKIPEIFDHVTHDSVETRVHACSYW
uniref:Uncharacterized protein n=1 Tax=Romanomermis culicivorax TaxID=13658 RepID=A0A915IFX6_ROMCU